MKTPQKILCKIETHMDGTAAKLELKFRTLGAEASLILPLNDPWIHLHLVTINHFDWMSLMNGYKIFAQTLRQRRRGWVST